MSLPSHGRLRDGCANWNSHRNFKKLRQFSSGPPNLLNVWLTRPGKRLHNYGKSPYFKYVNHGKSTINHQFSIAFCMFSRSLKIDVLQTQFLDPPWSTRSRDLSVPELFFPHHKDDPLAIRSPNMPGIFKSDGSEWSRLVAFCLFWSNDYQLYGTSGFFWAPEFTGEASKSHVQQLFC